MNGPAIAKLGGMRRKPIRVDEDSLVRFTPLNPDSVYTAVCQPTRPGISLVAWAQANRELIERKLLEHGALLFRDFQVDTAQAFDDCISALSGGALEYKFRASPRTQVDPRLNIYTSTDYPKDQRIFPHNEHSYSPVFPLKIFLWCDIAPLSRGETPIGDTRAITRAIDPEIRERFARLGIMYVRNYGDGFGLPWQTVFQTDDRAQVDAYCAGVGIHTEWKADGRLRTRQVGPALVQHPRTGETLWFNHATFFHVSTLPASVRDALQADFADDDLPQNTFYGDGSPIEPPVLEHLRGLYLQHMTEFPWRHGDVLLLDNMLSVHARNEYDSPRRILVSMAEALNSQDVALKP
ncbi:MULTISPECIES: TauD/TfdA family dioxygenase [Pseudomonas]|jgi:alpha-ketoglutarate-dependent taurine dioxygenase|uniref:TauD/TfdA family dioxygenase n=1 Tax=Pseudomonas TaxID=286 RepID=UPI000D00EBDB|nr:MULTISPECIES: TauD/TfdA family dioxygenase [Pseudomonas]PRA49222.1 taurine catabolism dioxygenase TauD [Pseudomonas sp. MYb115]QXN52579.1 TauD/TfdA family dioxygenase [Pseudomonas fluorescens]WSO26917.1 TauD/TfdA family dioxygenase [Pseudomonas fluorescens]